MRVGIVGYGNLGKACEKIGYASKDMDIVGVFTRRDPSGLKSPYGTPFYAQSDVFDFHKDIDVLALCTGSAQDLTGLALEVAKVFNTVDTFDNHSKMKEYVQSLDGVAKEHGTLSIVGAGWDPGVLSLARCYVEGITGLKSHTFWGKGVSQGHSEAIRKIAGVKRAVQYTLPNSDAIDKVKSGQSDLSVYDKHKRECYVVVDDSADEMEIERKIKEMPSYFRGYETDVHFIDEIDFDKTHRSLYHKGQVLCYGNLLGVDNMRYDKNIASSNKATYKTENIEALDCENVIEDDEEKGVGIEFSLTIPSNPEFTATILMAYVRCAYRLYQSGVRGAKTVLDLPVSALFDCNRLDTIAKYL